MARVFSVYVSAHFRGIALFHRVAGSSSTQLVMFQELAIADGNEHKLEFNIDGEELELIVDELELADGAGTAKLKGVLEGCAQNEICSTQIGRYILLHALRVLLAHA